jgi:UDP-3-O-[3-hydroxymyristoyl] glucosamine N-acyltransferase
METVGLYGYGAHGRDIEEVWNRAHPDRNLLMFDDDPARDVTVGIPPAAVPCYLGLNWPLERSAVADRVSWITPSALVDPSVVVGSGCVLAGGVVVFPGVVMLRDVQLAEHVHVGYCASLARCTVGAFTTISPGALICGDVKVGEEVLIGCGAIVKNLVTIGDRAVIGAGAVVVNDIPADMTVTGIPARVMA